MLAHKVKNGMFVHVKHNITVTEFLQYTFV